MFKEMILWETLKLCKIPIVYSSAQFNLYQLPNSLYLLYHKGGAIEGSLLRRRRPLTAKTKDTKEESCHKKVVI